MPSVFKSPAVSPTFSTKAAFAVSRPSLTVRVIVVMPCWPGAGVIVALRAAPVPENTMFALGTTTGFDELPDMASPVGALSLSPTVKFTMTAVFLGVTLLVRPEIVGGVLPPMVSE